jgi:hypothetical protein
VSFPTREETRTVLRGLVEKTVTPSDANDWACPFVVDEATHPAELDTAVWNALTVICGADLPDIDGSPLHGRTDFASWLNRFDRECRQPNG